MGEFVRLYKFYGNGTIWDAQKNQPLCTFDRNGILETDDPYVIKKLMQIRTPYEDGKDTELERAEFAIEILTDRIDILEKLNSTLKDRLRRYEEAQTTVSYSDNREALMAELDGLGVPYINLASTLTLQYMVDEFKELSARKLRDSMGED